MKVIHNAKMWGHAAGCHKHCCGSCTCGYECLEYTDEEKRQTIEELLKITVGRQLLEGVLAHGGADPR